MNGQGDFFWSKGDTYSGMWKDGKMHGPGKLSHANGHVKDGEFENHIFITPVPQK